MNGQQSPEPRTVNGDRDMSHDTTEATRSLEKVDELDRVELEKIVNR